jgi:hypothetical protein
MTETVDCPCCSGSGEHVIDHADPQRVRSLSCEQCHDTGQTTPAYAAAWRVWAAEHGPGPTPHPTATVPVDPFLGPQGPEPF